MADPSTDELRKTLRNISFIAAALRGAYEDGARVDWPAEVRYIEQQADAALEDARTAGVSVRGGKRG